MLFCQLTDKQIVPSVQFYTMEIYRAPISLLRLLSLSFWLWYAELSSYRIAYRCVLFFRGTICPITDKRFWPVSVPSAVPITNNELRLPNAFGDCQAFFISAFCEWNLLESSKYLWYFAITLWNECRNEWTKMCWELEILVITYELNESTWRLR